jgi:hypothetical protein
MDDLGQFRAHVTFRLDPAAPAERMNLVEGFVSFALLVENDRSVVLSIVDADGNWSAVGSPPGLAMPGVWHTVVAAHDGVSEARIALGPQVVGSARGIRGPVRSIGPLGIAIGRWPDAPAYQLHGQLSEVALYKFDPEPEVQILLAPRCVDADALEPWFTKLASRFGGEEAMRSWASDVRRLLLDAGDAHLRRVGDTDAYRDAIAGLINALATRDGAEFTPRFNLLRVELGDGDRDPFGDRFWELRRALPLGDEEIRAFASALCLDRLWDG